MAANYSARIASPQTDFAQGDFICGSVLSLLRLRLNGESSRFPKAHSVSYFLKMLDGTKALPLASFIAFLQLVERIGNKKSGHGREWVRQILNVIAGAFGLKVVNAEDEQPLKAVECEELEFALANSDLLTYFHAARSDGRFTPDEQVGTESRAAAAEREIADLRRLAKETR